MTALLDVDRLSVRYGRIEAVRSVSLKLEPGEIVTVLGSNGAGKTSLLNALMGVVRPREGKVAFLGRDITQISPPRRVASGMSLVPEGRRILITMTVEENLLVGAYARGQAPDSKELAHIYDRFPNLAERRHMPASVLSGGEQQMLAIGRAMLARPELIMLDEPSLGLSPKLVGELFRLLKALNREEGMTLLLVEQNTHKALQLAGRGYVLELGRCVMSGTSAELLADPRLQEAYLGGDDAQASDVGSIPAAEAGPVETTSIQRS